MQREQFARALPTEQDCSPGFPSPLCSQVTAERERSFARKLTELSWELDEKDRARWDLMVVYPYFPFLSEFR